ncbi:hypothetical protein HN587_01960 [Candidatus Woesearchaeota archaeon]|jgi:hypothetical protein|nr:hypothetical protein [Candidatus Woesearchaeota archaeon]
MGREDQIYKVLGFGGRGDARVRDDNGRTIFVSNCPNGLEEGAEIGIRGLRDGRGSSDFANYAHPDRIQSTQTQRPAQSPLRRAEPKHHYVLHLGPSSRLDSCAIAVCKPEILEMNAYDALVHLVERAGQKNLFTTSTDRRIAKGLQTTYERAQGDDASEELVWTLNGEAITSKTTKKLSDYMRMDEGKYRAKATMTESDSTPTSGTVEEKVATPQVANPTRRVVSSAPSKPASAKPTPKKAPAYSQPSRTSHTIHRARATMSRRGSPGHETLDDLI